jgi:hypothetical protein
MSRWGLPMVDVEIGLKKKKEETISREDNT